MANAISSLLGRLDAPETSTPEPKTPSRKEMFSFLIEEAAIQESVDDAVKPKTFADCYLYGKSEMRSKLIEFVNRGSEVNKDTESFKTGIVGALKACNARFAFLEKVMNSGKVHLMVANGAPLPVSFKVFTFRGSDGARSTYIDVSGIIREINGEYSINVNDVPVLVSLLTIAMIMMIYNATPAVFARSNKLGDNTCTAFSSLVTYVIDYLRCATVPKAREKVIYLSTIYFWKNILRADVIYNESTIRDKAIRESSLTPAEANAVDYMCSKVPGWTDNIAKFIEAVALIINASELRIDNFIEKWIYLYKPGTQYALELYPAMAAMITNTFHQARLVNQVTIDKVVGKKLINLITDSLVDVGRNVLQ